MPLQRQDTLSSSRKAGYQKLLMFASVFLLSLFTSTNGFCPTRRATSVGAAFSIRGGTVRDRITRPARQARPLNISHLKVSNSDDTDFPSERLPEDANLLRRPPMDRRRTLLALGSAATTAILGMKSNAFAYDKEYPSDLDTADGYVDGRQRKLEAIREQEFERTSPITLGPFSQPLGAVLWGGALWLLTGSRSNPLVTPIANVLYDEKKEGWLKDRNEGLFADLPAPLFVVLAIVFVAAGYGTDLLVTKLSEGERAISLQLAGVTLISSASLELGRIASGEKKETREESDRGTQLEQEFAAFAANRLKPGGNCHRNEVVQAFRRYYAKYRQPDNPDYPLTDLEIERLLRNWSSPFPGIEMSSAGFYSGIQINTDADVFVAQR